LDDITLQQAGAAVAAAAAKAAEIGTKMNVAVVDAGANLKAFARSEEAAPPGSPVRTQQGV
jgi:uncharacterized protein GlcG (DUF336 family)